MGFSPLLHTADLVDSPEVIAVGSLVQPVPLTGGLAGLATVGTGTVALMVSVSVVGTEKLAAMAAFTPARL